MKKLKTDQDELSKYLMKEGEIATCQDLVVEIKL